MLDRNFVMFEIGDTDNGFDAFIPILKVESMREIQNLRVYSTSFALVLNLRSLYFFNFRA